MALRLYESRESAAIATRRGLTELLARQLRHDLGWLERDLRSLRKLGPLVSTLVPIETLQADALAMLRSWVCERPVSVLTEEAFRAVLGRAREDLRGIVPRLEDRLREVFELRQALLLHPHPSEDLAGILGRLVPPDCLRRTSWPRLTQLPRYLRALQMRADRWRQNPKKDRQRAAQIAPYDRVLTNRVERDPEDSLRWLVEEYRVSLFAQELGTAEPVSAVKLDRLIAKQGSGSGAAEEEPALPSPGAKVRPVAGSRKKQPVKSLGALDRLFRP